jgi:hypothetical protein
VVQQQLDAYNTGDIESFMDIFSEDIELWTLGDSIPSVSGYENVRNVYANLFEKSPDLYSEVLNRTILGNKVIDYEKITGRNSGEVLFLIMIYEVQNGKIVRATAVRE